MTAILRSGIVALTALVLADSHAGVHAQTYVSTDAARDLVYALERRGLDAIAVADTNEPGTFVAALYIPRSQLLVISARHPSSGEVAHRIARHQYREVYLDLHRSPTPRGKFFVQDSRANGILSALPGSGMVDVLYEDGVRRTRFDGDIEAQNLTRRDYDAKLRMAESRYSHLLKLLTAAVNEATAEFWKSTR